jgi:hypothetical protein
MVTTLAFNVYGTLINTRDVSDLLEIFVGTQSSFFMETWRSKQLEYSFRHGLMKDDVDFLECTRNPICLNAVFDPWGIEPTEIVNNIPKLDSIFQGKL